MKTEREKREILQADLCVIGGGMAGVCAAVAAARRGVRVVLLQDRPVLGGNASSEIRMWIRGASTSFPQYREGGIIEELANDNIFHNPSMNFSLWDAVVYNKVIAEKNITLLLNTTCIDAEEADGRIVSVTAWQLTSYKFFRVEAAYFADCSGDCILAEYTGAQCRRGRESRAEYGEAYAPEKADGCTMGNSCLLQARETDGPVFYTPPPFAYRFSDEEIESRLNIKKGVDYSVENFWWLETGGMGDTVRDAEALNKALIAKAFGAWDYIKNSGRFDSQKWELDWVGFLAGKRESRRYFGDYTLTQNDLEAAQPFADEVAYGGWTMDDHNPFGINTREPANIHHPIRAPYPIPYRCLYSQNMENLFFAGRNISVTHMALSSTRVMATCALVGQAVGTACAVALRYKTTARGVGAHMAELQQALRDDDCYLLHTPRKISEAVRTAETDLTDGQFRTLQSGIERKLGDVQNVLEFRPGQACTFVFEKPQECAYVRILFDNDIAGERYGEEERMLAAYPNRCNLPKNAPKARVAPSLVKAYRVDVLKDGAWQPLFATEKNEARLVKLPVHGSIGGFRFVGTQTYGSGTIRLFSLDICD